MAISKRSPRPASSIAPRTEGSSFPMTRCTWTSCCARLERWGTSWSRLCAILLRPRLRHPDYAWLLSSDRTPNGGGVFPYDETVAAPSLILSHPVYEVLPIRRSNHRFLVSWPLENPVLFRQLRRHPNVLMSSNLRCQLHH